MIRSGDKPMLKVSSEIFRAVHGHRPRGYGDWTFAIERNQGDYTCFRRIGQYADVLKAAKAEAKLIGGATRIIIDSCAEHAAH